MTRADLAALMNANGWINADVFVAKLGDEEFAEAVATLARHACVVDSAKIAAATAAYVALLDPEHRTDAIADARYRTWVALVEDLTEDEKITLNDQLARLP